MANTVSVTTQVRNEAGAWSDGPVVLFVKSGIAAAWEADGKGAVETSGGAVYYTNKSLSQIETFLNS